MGLAISQVHKLRQVAVSIKAHVDLYGTFGLAELGPGKYGKAKLNKHGVEQIDLAAEFEPMLGSKLLDLPQQFMKYRLVEFGRLPFVHPSQRGTGAWIDGQVVQCLLGRRRSWPDLAGFCDRIFGR